MLVASKINRAELVAEWKALGVGCDAEIATLRQHVFEAERELDAARQALARFEGEWRAETMRRSQRIDEIKRLLTESASHEIDAAIDDCSDRIARAQAQRRIATSLTTITTNAPLVDAYILACRDAVKQLNRLRTSEDDSARAIKAIMKTIPAAHFPETTSPRKQQ